MRPALRSCALPASDCSTASDVWQGKIRSLEQIFLFSLAVKEYQVGGRVGGVGEFKGGSPQAFLFTPSPLQSSRSARPAGDRPLPGARPEGRGHEDHACAAHDQGKAGR